MIKTLQYNDFSEFDYTMNSEQLFNELKQFKESGGDLSLPVKVGYSIDEFKLISLKKFIEDKIKNPAEFTQKLMQEGILPGICDFHYDSEKKKITETQDYGLRWMKQNYLDYKNVIHNSIKNLLNQMPSDLTDTLQYYGYDYQNKLELKSNYINEQNVRGRNIHPLLYITTEINQPVVHELVLNKYPKLKDFWESKTKFASDSKEDKYKFLEPMEGFYGNIRKPGIGTCFYKLGIGRDYFLSEEHSEEMYDLIKHAAYDSDIKFLEDVLPKINLKDLEKNKYSYDLSLAHSKNKEVANLLLKNGATVSHIVKDSEVNLLYSEDFKRTEVLDAILEYYPNMAKDVVSKSDDFYASFQRKNFESIKLLVEKYGFPLEKYDMLCLNHNNRLIKNDNEDSFAYYDWVVKSGADVRRCDKFCANIVSAREEGLKILRGLNKKGLLVSKSPDIIFNIFQNSPTKNFITYFDKCSNVELEKHTVNGNPAWWGAKHQTDLKWMLQRVQNKEQAASDGKPFVFYLFEKELEDSKISPKSLLETIIPHYKKNPNFNFNLDYTDKNNNNILHLIFTTQQYRKKSIDKDVIDLINNNSKSTLYDKLMEKNNNGVTPMEILLTTSMNYEYNRTNILKDIIFNHSDKVDFNSKLTNSDSVSDLLLKYFDDDKEIQIKLHAIILEKELNKKQPNSIQNVRKNKI